MSFGVSPPREIGNNLSLEANEAELIVPGGRFYGQSKLAAKLLNDIPGVTCVEPQGALYCFAPLDPGDDLDPVVPLTRVVLKMVHPPTVGPQHPGQRRRHWMGASTTPFLPRLRY